MCDFCVGGERCAHAWSVGIGVYFFSLSVGWERREDELYERLVVAYQNRQVKKEKKIKHTVILDRK